MFALKTLLHQTERCHLLILAIVVNLFLIQLIKLNKGKRLPNTWKKLHSGGDGGLPFIGDSIKWYTSISSSHSPSFVEEQARRYIMHNEVGKHGVIVVEGEQQKKLHGILVYMMRLEKLNSNVNFLDDIQKVMFQRLLSFEDDEVVALQNVCRKVAINLMVNQLLGVSCESEINEIASLFSNFVDGCLSIPINLHGFPFHKAIKLIKPNKRKRLPNTWKKFPPGGDGGLPFIADSIKWYNSIFSSHPPSFVEEQVKRQIINIWKDIHV